MKDVTPYRLWYECLKRSNRKDWVDRVRQHFTAADGLAFEPWWDLCRHLFIDDSPLTGVQVIDSRDEFDLYWNEMRGDDSFAVWIDLNARQEDLIADFDKLVRAKHAGARGRPKKEGTLAEFDLAGHCNIKATWMALACYDLEKTMRLWEIGAKCKVSLSQIPDDEDEEPTPEQKRVLAVTVSRYLGRAKALIEGTERGIFPVPAK